MNKLLIVTALLAFCVMASFASATTVISLYANNTENIADTYFDSSDIYWTGGGSATDIWLGNLTSGTPKNESDLFKFNLASIPNNATIFNATLFLFETTSSSCWGVTNWTVWGINNQTWYDNGPAPLTLGNFTSSAWSTSIHNLTTWNNTWVCGTGGWWKANVTKWLSYAYANGIKNATFYVNVSFATAPTGGGVSKFATREHATVAWHPMLNITYGLNIQIYSPTNTTYYNNYTLPLNISNNTFNYNICYYSWNNGYNQTFTPNTTIEIPTGNNNLWVWCNDSTNAWYSNYVNFGMFIVCNSTWNNISICTGINSMFITQCMNTGIGWQFSGTNQTRCDGSCYRGQCLSMNIQKVCFNQCNVSSDQKSCGGVNKDYAINCTYDKDGCQIWNPYNSSFCQNGCYNGMCLNCTSQCKIGEIKCIGDYVYPCTNQGNCTGWDINNGTFCEYGCFIKLTGGIETDYCNYHSFNVTYNITRSFWAAGKAVEIVFPDIRSREVVVIIFAIILAIVLMWFSGNWQLGVIGAVGIMWLGAFAGWFDYFQLIIYTLIGIFIIFVANRE